MAPAEQLVEGSNPSGPVNYLGSYAGQILLHIRFEKRRRCTLPYKLTTTVRNVNSIENSANAGLISEFHQFMIANASSERHQNNNLKAIICFARFLGPSVSFLRYLQERTGIIILRYKNTTSRAGSRKEMD